MQWRWRWVRRRWRCPIIGTYKSIGYRSLQYLDLGHERTGICKLAVGLSVIQAAHRSWGCDRRPRRGWRSASWLGFTTPLTLSRRILQHAVSYVLHGRRRDRFVLHPLNSRPDIIINIHHHILRLSYIFHIMLLVCPFRISSQSLVYTILIHMHPFVPTLL